VTSQPQPGAPAPVDLSNHLLDLEQPSGMQATVLRGPPTTVAVTIRTPTTTVTVGLKGADVNNWIAVLTAIRAQMGTSLIIPTGMIPPPTMNGRDPRGNDYR
jgi:hypothetical protein